MQIKALKKRSDHAQIVKDEHWPRVQDVIDYVTPYRGGGGTTNANDNNSTVEIFDATAVIAGFRFAGKLQRDISPVDGLLYTVAPGPLVKPRFGEDVYQEMSKLLKVISIITAAFNHSGEWDTAFWEMALDMVGGTGFMYMMEGDSDDKPARYFAVAPEEIKIEGDGFGDISGIFWARKWTLRAILSAWSKASLGKKYTEIAKKDAEKEVVLHQDTIWLPKKKRWELNIWIEGESTVIIDRTTTRTCTWLTPRYYKMSNKVWGLGVANLNMPAIKTANTALRITLLAAGIAMMGIYTAVDDGVFNPDLSPIQPGAIWKVRANGGVFGPSIQRMQPPNIDLSNIVVDDLRMSIKAGMLDDSLPPDTGSVRSPTEILERVKRLADDHMGSFGRLIREIIIPKAKRDIEIAFNKKLIPQDINIDQLLVRVQVQSPVALARETERVQNIINWLEVVISIASSSQIPVKYIAKVEKALGQLGEAMQVSPELIVTEKERETMQQEDQARAVAMAMAEAGAQAGAGQPVPGETQAGEELPVEEEVA